MKKKVIALILYFALLLSSVFPATALAEGEPDAGSLPAEQAEAGGQQGGGDTPEPASTETPACTCTVKCSEGAVYSNCPVCSAAADLSACQGAEPQPANEQGDGDTPEPASTDTPVCICTAKCSEGAVNEQCPVCGADWSSCAFTEESGEPEPDSEQEPDKGPESVTVTEWSWVDDMKALAEDGKLYLGAAVTEENLEGIIALLPQYIQAGEEQIALA